MGAGEVLAAPRSGQRGVHAQAVQGICGDRCVPCDAPGTAGMWGASQLMMMVQHATASRDCLRMGCTGRITQWWIAYTQICRVKSRLRRYRGVLIDSTSNRYPWTECIGRSFRERCGFLQVPQLQHTLTSFADHAQFMRTCRGSVFLCWTPALTLRTTSSKALAELSKTVRWLAWNRCVQNCGVLC